MCSSDIWNSFAFLHVFRNNILIYTERARAAILRYYIKYYGPRVASVYEYCLKTGKCCRATNAYAICTFTCWNCLWQIIIMLVEDLWFELYRIIATHAKVSSINARSIYIVPLRSSYWLLTFVYYTEIFMFECLMFVWATHD